MFWSILYQFLDLILWILKLNIFLWKIFLFSVDSFSPEDFSSLEFFPEFNFYFSELFLIRHFLRFRRLSWFMEVKLSRYRYRIEFSRILDFPFRRFWPENFDACSRRPSGGVCSNVPARDQRVFAKCREKKENSVQIRENLLHLHINLLLHKFSLLHYYYKFLWQMPLTKNKYPWVGWRRNGMEWRGGGDHPQPQVAKMSDSGKL